ncbi:MAG: TetR/AcrR family transcriptional regulator [Phenylobacterium zucineum]|nr:MAG: TetR/AcrR family transcriptional regulator [Phenylobacterium zucineum]
MTAPAIDARKPPRQARAVAMVETMLEAAARILEAEGLGGFNTNAVAAKAGASIGSLYQYFPGKAALLAALIRRKREQLLAAMSDEAADAADLGSLVDGLIRVALRHQLERPRLTASLEYAETTLPLDAETRALKRAIVVTVAGALARHGVEQPLVAARDLAAMTRGMADAAGLFGDGDPSTLEMRIRRAARGYLGLAA